MHKAHKITFIRHLGLNQKLYSNIKNSTSPVIEIIQDKTDKTFYLDSTGSKGYAIDGTGELTSLFSTIKGEGTNLVRSAIKNGAKHLDCFDGFLPTFYKKFGFIEVKRVPNWTEGEPDVVFMELPAQN